MMSDLGIVKSSNNGYLTVFSNFRIGRIEAIVEDIDKQLDSNNGIDDACMLQDEKSCGFMHIECGNLFCKSLLNSLHQASINECPICKELLVGKIISFKQFCDDVFMIEDDRLCKIKEKINTVKFKLDEQEIDYTTFSGLDDAYLFTIEDPLNPLITAGNDMNALSIDDQVVEDALIDNNRCCLIS